MPTAYIVWPWPCKELELEWSSKFQHIFVQNKT
jgi:hypothetical protein